MTNKQYSSPFIVLFYANDLRQNKTELKLESFKSLRENWHYGEGGPISNEVIKCARGALSVLAQLGLSRTNAFPGINGEVLLTAYYQDYYIEVLIEPDHTAAILLEKDKAEIKEIPETSWEDIKPALAEIARIVWNLSDSYTQSTTTPKRETSSVWRSKPLAMTARRLSGSNVSRLQA